MEAILNCTIERTRNFVLRVLGVDDDHAAGEFKVIGATLIGFLVEKCAGATVRAASIAAGAVPSPDRATFVFEAEDITVPKIAGDDAIAAGAKVWFSVDDNVFVSSLAEVDNAGACYYCGTALELSNDTADTIRIYLNGAQTVSEAGTA